MERKIVKVNKEEKIHYKIKQALILSKPKIPLKFFKKVHTLNYQLYNPGPKIGFCTAYNDNFKNVAEITVPTFKHYCEKHGYDYIEVTNCNCGRHPVWEKIFLLKERLKDYDYLFWCDCDAIITNNSIKLESFICNQDLIITHDLFGLNAGVFLIKNSEWSKNYLNKVWDACGTIPSIYKSYGGDQSAMEYMAKGEDSHIKVVNQCIFNSYKNSLYDRSYNEKIDWEPGDFILHLPGIENSCRIKIFKDTIEEYRLW